MAPLAGVSLSLISQFPQVSRDDLGYVDVKIQGENWATAAISLYNLFDQIARSSHRESRSKRNKLLNQAFEVLGGLFTAKYGDEKHQLALMLVCAILKAVFKGKIKLSPKQKETLQYYLNKIEITPDPSCKYTPHLKKNKFSDFLVNYSGDFANIFYGMISSLSYCRNNKVVFEENSDLLKLASMKLAKQLTYEKGDKEALDLLIQMYRCKTAGFIAFDQKDLEILSEIKVKIDNLPYKDLVSFAIKGADLCLSHTTYPKIKGQKKKTYVEVNANSSLIGDLAAWEVPYLSLAVIITESNGDHSAVNGATGCSGLMQLHGDTPRIVKKMIASMDNFKSLITWKTSKEENVVLGTAYLRYIAEHHNLTLNKDVKNRGFQLTLLALMSYAGTNGELNNTIRGFIDQLNRGEQIDWYSANFRAKHTGWWRYIVKVPGAFEAIAAHVK